MSGHWSLTLPVATRVNARHISPSRYSTAAGQTDPQAASSADRHRSSSGRAAPRAAVCHHADEQEEARRFITGSEDRENNYDNDCNNDYNDNAGVERSANGASDNDDTTGQP